MTGLQRLEAQDELASESIRLLEQAYALRTDLGPRASELLDAAGGSSPHTRAVHDYMRRAIREYGGRLHDTGSTPEAEIAQLGDRCRSLARVLKSRETRPGYCDLALAGHSIFSAVIQYRESCAVAVRVPRRGKPSKLTTPEAGAFIEALADIWQAYTGRHPWPGDGESGEGTFNGFLVKAFALVGVEANPYTLHKITREIIG